MKFYISVGGDDWLALRAPRYAQDLRDRGHEAVQGGRYDGGRPTRGRYSEDLGKLTSSDYLVVTMEPGQYLFHADQALEIGAATVLEIPILSVGPIVGPMCLAHAQFPDWLDFLNSPIVKVRRQTPDMATAILNLIRATDTNAEA